MKTIIAGFLIALVSIPAFSKDVTTAQSIGYVYLIESTDNTAFDIDLPNRVNQCGSTLYRSKSNDTVIAARKFSAVLTAFTANYKIKFNDNEVCEGNRSLISWIRIVR
jgi:hypothetical protein